MKKISLLLVLLLGYMHQALAQGCSVCTKTASELGENGARGLNNGILYLAALPLVFMGTVGYIWYRRNKG